MVAEAESVMHIWLAAGEAITMFGGIAAFFWRSGKWTASQEALKATVAEQGLEIRRLAAGQVLIQVALARVEAMLDGHHSS